jgi:hypothetical protein
MLSESQSEYLLENIKKVEKNRKLLGNIIIKSDKSLKI